MTKGLFDEWERPSLSQEDRFIEESRFVTRAASPQGESDVMMANADMSGDALSEHPDALVEAGEYLANMLARLQVAVDAVLDRSAYRPEDTQKMSGIEETKLLASLDKWQRRYNALDEEQKALAAAYAELLEKVQVLEQENELLRHAIGEDQKDNIRQQGMYDEISARLERSLAVLEKVLN